MFDSLHDKLDGAFKRIRGKGKVSEKDITATMKEVRMALLEADVNFKVAKDFCATVAEKAVGEEVLKSLTPDQQIIKIVNEELTTIMGGEVGEHRMGAAATDLDLNVAPPLIIMLVGLQGAGKTTASAKLALHLRKEHKRSPLLVPADVYRPAAIEQLKTLGKQLQVPVYESTQDMEPLAIAKQAVNQASIEGHDVVILDTAGRLQIDDELMKELQEVSDEVQPHEILLVADAMTGQEAVNVAKGFDSALEIDGLILTKMDGDARGGAALSMKAVTGKPIKFIGTGEKMDALEAFHPDRMASRILGMGDVLGLIEKATKEIDLEESMRMHNKFKKDQFTLEDFLNQLRMIRRMGSIGSLMGMMPGMKKVMKQVNEEDAEKEMRRIEAIILSMTPSERQKPATINGSRRKRIAKGSGTSVTEVNKLLKQFTEMKKIMRQLTKGGMGNLMNMMGGKIPGMGGLKR